MLERLNTASDSGGSRARHWVVSCSVAQISTTARSPPTAAQLRTMVVESCFMASSAWSHAAGGTGVHSPAASAR